MRSVCNALVLAGLVVLAGCQAVSPKLAENVARVVAHYCAEPAEARALYRAAVDELTAPNQVRVTCAADAPEPAPDPTPEPPAE
jgi:hypothetical protein